MDKEKIDLLTAFDRLDPEIQADVLAHVRVAYAAQENTKRRLIASIGPEYADRNPTPMGAALVGEAFNG